MVEHRIIGRSIDDSSIDSEMLSRVMVERPYLIESRLFAKKI